MKKIFSAAAMAAILSVGMASCGGDKTGENNAQDSVVVVSETVEVVSDDASADKVVDLTAEQYEAQVAKLSDPMTYIGTEPCIIDFWATWCGPCMRLTPVMHELSKETGIKVVKIDVDNAKAVADAYGITSIPALFLAADGKIVPYEGDRSKADLVATANKLLKK